jgi:hypothetical protein
MQKYSLKLIKLKKEFTLLVINRTGADIFMFPSRTLKRGSRIISVKLFKNEKTETQEEFFMQVPNDKAGGVPSFSIPNSEAKIEITANFYFTVTEDPTTNEDFVHITIGKIEN